MPMTPLCCSAKSTALRKEIGSTAAASAAMQGAQESTRAQARAATLTPQPTRVILLKQRGLGRILKLYLVKRFDDIRLLQPAKSFASAVETGRQSKRCLIFRGGGRTTTHLLVDLTRSEEHTSELQSLRHLVCR